MAEGSKTNTNRNAANSSLRDTNLLGSKSSIDRSSGGSSYSGSSIFGSDTSIPVLQAKDIDFPNIESSKSDAIELLELKYGSDWREKAPAKDIQRARDLTRSQNAESAREQRSNDLNSKIETNRTERQPSFQYDEKSARANRDKVDQARAIETVSPEAKELLILKYGEDWESKAPANDIRKATDFTRSQRAQGEREQRSKELNSNIESNRSTIETNKTERQPPIQYDEKSERANRDKVDQARAIETVSPEAKELLILKYGEDWESKAPANDIRKATQISSSQKAQGEREQRSKELNSNIQTTRTERQPSIQYDEKTARANRDIAEREKILTVVNDESSKLLEMKYGETWRNVAPVDDMRKADQMTSSQQAQRERSLRSSEITSNIETVRIEREEIERQKQLELLEPKSSDGSSLESPRPEQTVPLPQKSSQPSLPETIQKKPAVQPSVSVVPPEQQIKETIIERNAQPGDLTGVTPDGRQFTVDKTGRVTYGSPQSSNTVQSPRINATNPQTNLQIVKETENSSLALAEKTITEYNSNKSEFEHEQAKAQINSTNSIKDSSEEERNNIQNDSLLDVQSSPLLSSMVDKGKRSYPNIKESFNKHIGVKMNDPPSWRVALG
jgi:hypothetical protein